MIHSHREQANPFRHTSGTCRRPCSQCLQACFLNQAMPLILPETGLRLTLCVPQRKQRQPLHLFMAAAIRQYISHAGLDANAAAVHPSRPSCRSGPLKPVVLPLAASFGCANSTSGMVPNQQIQQLTGPEPNCPSPSPSEPDFKMSIMRVPASAASNLRHRVNSIGPMPVAELFCQPCRRW